MTLFDSINNKKIVVILNMNPGERYLTRGVVRHIGLSREPAMGLANDEPKLRVTIYDGEAHHNIELTDNHLVSQDD